MGRLRWISQKNHLPRWGSMWLSSVNFYLKFTTNFPPKFFLIFILFSKIFKTTAISWYSTKSPICRACLKRVISLGVWRGKQQITWNKNSSRKKKTGQVIPHHVCNSKVVTVLKTAGHWALPLTSRTQITASQLTCLRSVLYTFLQSTNSDHWSQLTVR
jgi:hypothetical protein